MDNEILRKVQLAQLDMAKEVKRICNKYNINYFMDSGTLLGAVRHKGFIPWDDDLDFGMLREDYEKFLKVAPTELNSKYFLQTWKNDDGFPYGFSKIRKKNTIYIEAIDQKTSGHKELWIDIFPYDVYPDDVDCRKEQGKKLMKYRYTLMMKVGMTPWARHSGIIEKILVFCKYIPYILLSKMKTISISGMNKGIRWLSDKNAWMFMGLMILAFLFGPGQWICNLFVESLGNFLGGFVQNITAVSAFNDAGQAVGSVWHKSSELWSQWWDQYYFVDYLSFGPIVGLFSIKLAKGRTLREYVVMNWAVPAIFGVIWFAIFGGLALDIQYNYSAYADVVNLQGCASLFDYMQQFGNEAMMLKVIEVIPFANILKPLVLLLVVLSFVTMADSTTSTVSLMSIVNNKDVEEAPMGIKLFWAIIMGAASLIFTLTGSIDGIKIVKTIAGFPILIMGIVMVVMFIIYIIKHGRDKEIKDMMG